MMRPVECVLLESVQSQAKRVEEALPDAVAEERIQIPVVDVDVDFSNVPMCQCADPVDPVDPVDSTEGLYEPIGRVTSLAACPDTHVALDDVEQLMYWSVS